MRASNEKDILKTWKSAAKGILLTGAVLLGAWFMNHSPVPDVRTSYDRAEVKKIMKEARKNKQAFQHAPRVLREALTQTPR